MNVGCGTGPTHLTWTLPESGGEDTSAFVPFPSTRESERHRSERMIWMLWRSRPTRRSWLAPVSG